ncbi:MAG: divergent polysaccharide deacetylase family protein [Rhodospirillaceae bacterium]|nr:divergent polysaccharide deacetylase family protein [Rhodospirillaceae bacterium]MBT6136373.1 divergent polysaccharide deacetylase family protein [Rhodospirillaceae bacterium]MBT7755536.1 divergent polysaccharide deacetylase family protein [Candidatus Magasanikbacteria bacterium]
MKLPFSISLPKISLPFLKRKAKDSEAGGDALADDFEDIGEEGDDLDNSADAGEGTESDASDDDAEAAGAFVEAKPKKQRNWKRLAGIIGTVVLGLVVLGGAGAIIGWLVVSAEHTIADRQARQPTLTLAILAEGEEAKSNSSLASMPAAHGDDGKADDGHGSSTSDSGDQGDGHGAKKAEGKAESTFQLISPDLVEDTPKGQLPIRAADGRQSWTTYAGKFDKSDRRPRISIVVVNLGLSRPMTEAVIENLPPEVSLSFSPIAPANNIKSLSRLAREKGHEIYLDLPLEPTGYPRDDPGPKTLLSSLSAVENLNRLEWVLTRGGGYVGVVIEMGDKFTVVKEAMMPVLQYLKERGLFLIDSRASSRSLAPELAASIQLPRAFNDQFIDRIPAVEHIDRHLIELERVARDNKFALGVAQPYPVTLDRLALWIRTLKGKNIALAPATALADKQSLR